MEGGREQPGDVVHNGIMVANTIEKYNIKKRYDMGYLIYVVQLISIIMGNSPHFQS